MSESQSKIALQFGAGNIGRGFIGVMLSRAGYGVVFVDVVEPLLELINQRRQYTVIESNEAGINAITVQNIRAINSKAEAEVVAEIGRASLITTAVGPNVLSIVAPTLARGLQERARQNLDTPLNIVACENLIDNSKILKEYVLAYLPKEYHPYVDSWVGFPNCVVDKVVTAPSEAQRQQDPLAVATEGHGLLIVDQGQWAGDLPDLPGMRFTQNLDAYVEQKIFTLNTAHAITAYLGYLRGHEFIHQALADPQIRPVVLGAIAESSAALVKRHGLDPEAQQQYVQTVLARFENAAMPDPIVRVAREPERKLAPNDRLVKPALLALEIGVTPVHLAAGIAAALRYNHPDDPQAVALSQKVQTRGVERVLQEVCRLSADSPLVQLVKEKLSMAQNDSRLSQQL